MEHPFTAIIREILATHFGEKADQIFETSYLIQYLNIKTRSATRGSKSRSAFANHYALYILIEDYVNKGFSTQQTDYSTYEGAKYTDLLMRQRQLPFGNKLQNHALNSRLNEEFAKYFPTANVIPIVRDTTTKRYWININLLRLNLEPNTTIDISKALLAIIDAYVEAKRDAFQKFIHACEQLQALSERQPAEAAAFIRSQLAPQVDARIFEIISFAILKAFYADQFIYWGWSLDSIQKDYLTLYKTGRTNANDGGIDFVMQPLGRFFQVTETTDVKKYFLDIDKLQKYPLTFVIK